MRGGAQVPAWLLVSIVGQYRSSGCGGEDHSAISGLTVREREVLDLMVNGFDRSAIAARLYRSPNTVRTHIGHILVKLGAHSVLEAVAIALRSGVRPQPLAPERQSV